MEQETKPSHNFFYFEKFGLRYIGPMTGMISSSYRTIPTLPKSQSTGVLHVLTTKGKGYNVVKAQTISRN